MNDDSTKKRILEAAERLLENGGGLEAMTVRAIAKEADVPLASINYHFGSKETLIDQIVENKMMPHVEAMYRNSEGIDDPAARLIKMLTDNSSAAMNMLPLSRRAVEKEVQEGSKTTMRLIVPLLRQICGSGTSEPEIKLLAFQLLLPMQIMFIHPEKYERELETDLSNPEKREEIIKKMLENLLG